MNKHDPLGARARDYTVERIEMEDAREMVLVHHYSHSWPSVSHRYGLFKDGTLIGVCTFGTPPTNPARIAYFGKERAPLVQELNRLVLLPGQLKNEAGILVSRALRML